MAEFSSLNGYGVKDPTARQSATDERAARIAADNDLQLQISAIANPSPQAVSSTSQMTDTTKIYVNTTDGYWYYYNGTAWTQGGVWQSEGIADNSISPEKTTFYKRTSNLFNKYNYDHFGGYPTDANEILLNSATIAASHSVVFPCTPNTTYHLRARYTNKFRVACTAVYPENGTPCTNYVNADSNPNITYTTTQNAAYIVLFFYNSNAQPQYSLTQIANTLMISEGETQNYYEPYAYVDVNSVTEDGSISTTKLENQYLMLYEGQIYFDWAAGKIYLSDLLTDCVNMNATRRYPISQNVARSYDMPNDSRLYAMTATIENNTVTSIQLELYNTRQNKNLICLFSKGDRYIIAPFDYTDQLITEPDYAKLYSGKIVVDKPSGRVYLNNPQFVLDYSHRTVRPIFDGEAPTELTLPTDQYLYALTMTIEKTAQSLTGYYITSLQFEHYQNIDPRNYIICWVGGTGGVSEAFAPFDYGNRFQTSISADATSDNFVSLGMFNRIAAIGDSYTQGGIYYDGQAYDSQNRRLSYIGVMGRRNGTDWDNYGIGGATTQSYLSNPNGLAKVLSSAKADLYYLALGINDANRYGSSYLGTIDDITEDYTQNPDTFYGNYARIIEQVKAYAPYAKLVMVGNMRPNSMNPQYGVYTEAISNIAAHYGIPFINPYDDSFFTSSVMTTLSGNHPTAAGYTGIALALERLTSKAITANMNYFMDADRGSVVS